MIYHWAVLLKPQFIFFVVFWGSSCETWHFKVIVALNGSSSDTSLHILCNTHTSLDTLWHSEAILVRLDTSDLLLHAVAILVIPHFISFVWLSHIPQSIFSEAVKVRFYSTMKKIPHFIFMAVWGSSNDCSTDEEDTSHQCFCGTQAILVSSLYTLWLSELF